MFLKNKNVIFKIRRSKVTDYATLTFLHSEVTPTKHGSQVGEFVYQNTSSLCDVERHYVPYIICSFKEHIVFPGGREILSIFLATLAFGPSIYCLPEKKISDIPKTIFEMLATPKIFPFWKNPKCIEMTKKSSFDDQINIH